ncbi:hypothetical protein [Methylobacterium oxalidis]
MLVRRAFEHVGVELIDNEAGIGVLLRREHINPPATDQSSERA